MEARRARSGISQKRSFLLSGLTNEKRQILGKKIRSLGGIYHDSEIFISNSTHIVCGKLSRSEKFLGGCATGKWILKPDYIEESYKCKQWLQEEQYEWCSDDAKIPEEKEIATAPRKWRGLKLLNNENAFAGINAALLVEGNKRKAVYRRLLTCGSAKMFILQLPIRNCEKINAVLQYIFADKSLAAKHIPPSLYDYGIMCLSPDYIGDFLIKETPPNPFDYFVVAPKGIPLLVKNRLNSEDVSICLSQESICKNSSPFSSQTTMSSLCSSKTSSPLKTSICKNTSPFSSQTTNSSSCSYKTSSPLKTLSQTPKKKMSSPSAQSKGKSPRSKPCPVSGQQLLSCFGFSSVKKEKVKDVVPCVLPQEVMNIGIVQKANVQKKLVFTTDDVEMFSVDENITANRNHETPSNVSFNNLATSVKRRLSTDEQLEASPRKKAKFGPIKSIWRPTFPVDLSNSEQVMNREVSSQPRELSMSMSHIIEMYLEEGHLLSGLNLVSCSMSSSFYLPSSTLHSIMTKVLLFSTTEHVTNMSSYLLMKHLSLHPPKTQAIQSLYSQSFHNLDEESTDNNMWTFTSSIMQGALNELSKEEEKLFNHLVLLKYLLSLFEVDFQHLSARLEMGESGKRIKRSCLFIKCMWSPGFLFFSNKNTRQLLLYYEECLTIPSSHPQKIQLIDVLSGYVNIAVQCFKMAESGWSMASCQRPFTGNTTENFISEFSQKILASHIQDCSILESILNSLRPSWFCLGVSAYLLSSYNDYLLLKGIEDSPITLRKIVTQYFFLLPRLDTQRLTNSLNTDVAPEGDSRLRKKKRSPDVKDENVRSIDNEANTPNHGTLNNDNTPGLTDQFIKRINRKNFKGETPLHTACIKNDVRRVKLLLTVPGIDVNAEDNYGWTPLHEACNHGNIECVELLLKYSPTRTLDAYFSPDSKSHKVDILKSNVEGITPLHDSVITNRPDICQLLIKHGGTRILSSKTKTGLVPLDYATTEELRKILSQDLETSSSQDSQSSVDSSGTDWVPTEYLYSEILIEDNNQRRTNVSDCSKFLSLIQSLILSYVNAHNLKKIYNILLKSRIHSSKLPSSLLQQTDSRVANCDTDSRQRLNVKFLLNSLKMSEEELEQSYRDVRILHKIKRYLLKFEDHLKRITSPEDYKMLLPKFHFLICSLTTLI